MSVLPEYIIDLLHEIAKAEGFIKYETNFEAGSKNGDGFFGIMTTVTISGDRQTDNHLSHDEIHVLCKMAPTSAARRQEFMVDKAFVREAAAYKKILPVLMDFQREKGLSEADGFYSFPKCYAAFADEEKNQFAIIMEDLRPKGFTMLPKEKPAPVDHYYLVLERLAKLHGISFALKDQRPLVYEDLKVFTDTMRKFFAPNSTWRNFLGYEEAIVALENEKHIEIIRELKANISEYFDDCFREEAVEPFGVITHGDCHNNNLLYQHLDGVRNTTPCQITVVLIRIFNSFSQTSQVKDVRFVDWQLCRYSSPVIDIFCLLFWGGTKPFRDRHYVNLLKHYHNSITETITKLGSDTEKLFSFNHFQNQFKKFAKFVFLLGPAWTQVPLIDPNNFPNLDKLAEGFANNKEDTQIERGYDDDTQMEYKRRINDLFTDLVDYGYYWKSTE